MEGGLGEKQPVDRCDDGGKASRALKGLMQKGPKGPDT
jgi:hypothetical protein